MPVAPRRDLVLEGAIAREGIDVLFQPLINTRTGAVIGAEALARTPIARSADVLFGRAAAANLGERLSRLVQRKALRSAAAWEGPLNGIGISINLLASELARPGYDRWLLDEIAAAGIDPRRVTVEITESGLLADHHAVSAQLAVLRSAGIRIAVDDFGTGYASLSYLNGLPLDIIKIDRGLITGIVARRRDQIVLKAMIQLARDLDLGVIVEGVETGSQLALLTEFGVEAYQGFLGAAALTLADLSGFASARSREAA